MTDNGYIERIDYGIYATDKFIYDEYYLFQLKHKNIVFSYNTALYFQNMTERTPFKMDVTTKRNTNLTSYKEFSEENLKQAITKTFDKRNTSLNDIETTLSMISESSFTKDLWKNYAKKHKYTENIKFEEIIDTIYKIKDIK